MKNWVVITTVLFLIGCSGKLRPDPSISAIEANYPTLEIDACGKKWHGLAMCGLQKDESYSKINLKIQGYNEGTLRVDSKNCNLDFSINYTNNQSIPIHVPGSINRNCIISFTLSPKFPNEQDTAIQIYSIRGHVAINLIDVTAWQRGVRKVSGNFSSELSLFSGFGESVVLMEGCGKSYKKKFIADNSGLITIELADAIHFPYDIGTCIIEGFLTSEELEDFSFNIFVAKYDSNFTPLPFPVITRDRKLNVEGDESVSIINLDDKIVVDRVASFKFDETLPHTLRLLTVKGRTVIGVWNLNNKIWELQQ